MSMEKYHFEANGETFTIPHFSQVPMGVIRKTRDIDNEFDKTMRVVELFLGEDSKELEAVDSMNKDQFLAFMKGWNGGENLPQS